MGALLEALYFLVPNQTISILEKFGISDVTIAASLMMSIVVVGILMFALIIGITVWQHYGFQLIRRNAIQPSKPLSEKPEATQPESSREDTGNRKLTRVEAHNLAKDDAVHYLSGTEAHSVGASYEPVREIIEDGELRYLIEGIAYDRNQRKWRFQVCVTQDRSVIPSYSYVLPIPSVPSATGVSDLDRAELTNLAVLGFRSLVREDSLKAKVLLDNDELGRARIAFNWWNQTRAELKKNLINDDSLYNALEAFSTAINNRNDRISLPPESNGRLSHLSQRLPSSL